MYRQPEFCDWAFNLRRGEQCLEKWDLIPEGIDILITHGPPIGHGDLCSSNIRAGKCINCARHTLVLIVPLHKYCIAENLNVNIFKDKMTDHAVTQLCKH